MLEIAENSQFLQHNQNQRIMVIPHYLATLSYAGYAAAAHKPNA